MSKIYHRGSHTCAHCSYWECFGPASDYAKSGDGIGECRRRSPVGRHPVDSESATWPLVRSSQWCGDFEWTGDPEEEA